MASFSNYKREDSKYTSKINLFKVSRNYRKQEGTKSEHFQNQLHIWVAYYRNNPHRFAKEFLGLNLHLFQAILLWAMMHHNIFMFVASRGLGGVILHGRDKHETKHFYKRSRQLHHKKCWSTNL